MSLLHHCKHLVASPLPSMPFSPAFANLLAIQVPPYADPNPLKTLLTAQPAGKALRWDSNGSTRAAFVDRTTMKLAALITMPQPISIYHVVSAWERESDGATVVMVAQVYFRSYTTNGKCLLQQWWAPGAKAEV